MSTTSTTIPSNETALETANKLLRGELSAVETYRNGLEKVGDDAGFAAQVQSMYDDHAKAVTVLQGRVRALGGEPSTESGAWGTFAGAVTSTAKLFGDAGALKALKEGEEHGLKDYESNLDDFDAETRQVVTGELIPATRTHIATLDRLIEAA